MRIDRGGIPVVLRRPPAVPRPDSAKVLGREARVLAALTGSDVPAPKLYAYCNDASVIGADFYIMENIIGWLALGEKTLHEAFLPAEIRRQLPLDSVGSTPKPGKVRQKEEGREGYAK